MFKREIQSKIEDVLHTSRNIVILYGARQVGKTTLVKNIIDNNNFNAEYFNCDYLDIQTMFRLENAGNFANIIGNRNLLVLDEAERIKDIGHVLKIFADEFPDVHVIATGSSSFELSGQISEPLTGRKRTFILFPLSWNEFVNGRTYTEQRRSLDRILRFGLYPAVSLKNQEQDISTELDEIANSYLFKDVFSFQTMKKPELVHDMVRLLAFQQGHEVSYNELAQKLKVDQTVVQRYINILEKAFVIFRLPALRKNMRNEIGKARKIYFWDNGIRNALIKNLNTFDYRNDRGQLWEGFCVSERQKFLSYTVGLKPNTYFWRTYAKQELDYIEEKGGVYNAYEFKWSESKHPSLPKSFNKYYPETTFQVVNRTNFHSILFDD